MRRVLSILGGSFLLCALFCVVAVGLVFLFTNGVATAADTFMTALQNEDFASAYAMFAPALQREVSSTGFSEMLAAEFGDDKVESWLFTSRRVTGGQGEVGGSATVGSRNYYVTLNFIYVEEWQLIAFNFIPQF
jgi:hypothetical protein